MASTTTYRGRKGREVTLVRCDDGRHLGIGIEGEGMRYFRLVRNDEFIYKLNRASVSTRSIDDLVKTLCDELWGWVANCIFHDVRPCRCPLDARTLDERTELRPWEVTA